MSAAYEQAEKLRLHKLDKRRLQQAAKLNAERERKKRVDQENKRPQEKVGNGMQYCGRKYCKDGECVCGECDGMCGPTGCACPSCTIAYFEVITIQHI